MDEGMVLLSEAIMDTGVRCCSLDSGIPLLSDHGIADREFTSMPSLSRDWDIRRRASCMTVKVQYLSSRTVGSAYLVWKTSHNSKRQHSMPFYAVKAHRQVLLPVSSIRR